MGIRNVTTSRDESFRSERARAHVDAILERALRTYHRDERHGGADGIGERVMSESLAD